MTKIRIPEKDIQRSILNYLEKRGVFAWRNNTGALVMPETRSHQRRFIKYGMPGSPDIIAVIEGYFVGLEVKDHTGKQNENQLAFQARLFRAGGIYFVVHTMDEAIEAVEDCITRLKLKGRKAYIQTQ